MVLQLAQNYDLIDVTFKFQNSLQKWSLAPTKPS